MSTNRLPTSLLEAVRYFSDPEVCVQFVAGLRWSDGPVCPACGGTEHSYLTTRRIWKCKNKECRKQFSVKVGTIFEDSAIPLDKWLCSIWLIANSKNGISSHELGRAVGLTQKSAWFVLHRIRLAMRTGSFQKFDGEIETDETWVGGRAINMHKTARDRRKVTQGGVAHQTMVVGSLQRATDDKPSQVHAEPMPDTEWDSPRAHVRRTVEPGADLYTDAAQVYRQLRSEYKHQSVDHSRAEYVRGSVGTNGIENFWSLLKRGITGTYVAVDPEHLWRYVDERVFTFNLRNLTDLERFQTVLRRVAGRRLTYAGLTA
jgi:transposase-like protein